MVLSKLLKPLKHNHHNPPAKTPELYTENNARNYTENVQIIWIERIREQMVSN
jgi:hypothetical protein